MRVLLVDDEKELVSTLAERLGFRGISADWASGAEDAIAKVETNSYDIAVLDVNMPEINGFELKQRLEKKAPNLKFIFMTGHGSEECYDIGCSETGEDYYLVKPVEINILVEKLNKAMTRKENL